MRYIPSLLACAASVTAHGFVQNATIGGKEYDPYQDPYMNPAPPRISRPIQGNFPVESVSLSDLQCGGNTTGGIIGSTPASLHAPAPAGSTVNLRWTAWPESHLGPILTYMARCCNTYLPASDPVWFKIAHDGLRTTNPDWLKSDWAVTPLITTPNSGVNYTIPACLKPGYYLVRHEIIALHSAYNEGGAQFYPGCHQLQVTGEGNGVPAEGLVSFPGAYESKDKGLVFSIYNELPYTIPGPEVWSCQI
ncbi:glycoside hydrolase [Paraphoma chrysanthemicola]|uniref:lytic cellulose monooxygenase (C4-dehydrogenating) n=1 Tax=Paraphoma chrysanthemicola TaxID=798071 RepID=A0A8K0VXD1_9PLEO|nr:glycoside hydrolase [Paraphoma chrysanthemicola]